MVEEQLPVEQQESSAMSWFNYMAGFRQNVTTSVNDNKKQIIDAKQKSEVAQQKVSYQ